MRAEAINQRLSSLSTAAAVDHLVVIRPRSPRSSSEERVHPGAYYAQVIHERRMHHTTTFAITACLPDCWQVSGIPVAGTANYVLVCQDQMSDDCVAHSCDLLSDPTNASTLARTGTCEYSVTRTGHT